MSSVDQEEVAELRALVEKQVGLFDVLKAQISEIRDEYVIEDGERGTGEMSDEEFDRLVERFVRMNDTHVVYTTMTLIQHLRGCLSGKDHDGLSMIQIGVAELLDRFAPDGVNEEALAIYEGQAELDIAYLDADDG